MPKMGQRQDQRNKRVPAFIWLALLTLSLPMVLAACRGQSAAAGNVQIDLRISPNPPAVGRSEVIVRLADAGGKSLEGATVEVEGNMTHPGMVPVLARAEEVGGGRYVVRDFAFTMGGDWILTVRAVLPSGERVERTFDVAGVRSERPNGAGG